MRILILNGNPKKGGFIEGCLEEIARRLTQQGADVEAVRLADCQIGDCAGCFQCLKTGQCVQQDDMPGIAAKMAAADGFVIGSPVRNGNVTACYKRFFERITYTLGFPLLLEDKYTLALSSVGYAGGKEIGRKLVGLQDVLHTHLSGYLFYAVGIPARKSPADVQADLTRAADRLVADIKTRRPRPLLDRMGCSLERATMRRLVFKKTPDLYANVISHWQAKGYY